MPVSTKRAGINGEYVLIIKKKKQYHNVDKLVHWEHTNQTKWHNSFLEDTSYTPPLTVGRKHSLLCERLVTEEEGFTRGTLVNGFRLVSKLVSKLASPQALVREPGNEASVEV